MTIYYYERMLRDNWTGSVVHSYTDEEDRVAGRFENGMNIESRVMLQWPQYLI